MLVTLPIESSAFQRAGFCSLPPRLLTDINNVTEMYCPHCCAWGLWLQVLLSPPVGSSLSNSLRLGRHLGPTAEIHEMAAHDTGGKNEVQQKDQGGFVH